MLSKELRLPSSEFLARGYRAVRTPYFSLKVKPNNLPKDRIGVIISIAAVKSAARRNFWKRQIKSGIGNKELRTKKFDFLVIFSKKGNSLTRKAFQQELKRARSLAVA